MIRKTLTILSLIGLLLSVGLWGVSYWGLHLRKSPIHVKVAKGGLSLVPSRLTKEEEESRLALLQAKMRSFHMEWDESKAEHVRVDPGRVSNEETALQREFDTLRQRQLWVDGFESLETKWALRLPTSPGQRSWYIPMWITTLLFGAMLGLLQTSVRHRCRKRKKLGLCVQCGYDLRGSAARCPECGNGFSK